MSAVVWFLAGIVVVNLLIAGWLVTLGLVDRYRYHRVNREVDALERSLAMPSAGAAGLVPRRMGETHRGMVVRERERVGGAHRSVDVRRLPGRHRLVGRASISLALAGMALWASVAIPDLGDRPATRSSADAEGLQFPVPWPTEAGSSGHVYPSGTRERGSAMVGGSLDPQTDTPPPPTNTNASTIFDAEIVIDRLAAQMRSSTQIRLAWAAVPKAIGYKIQRWGDGADPSGWVLIATVDAVTAFTDVGLEADTTYYYRVAAVTADGAAPPSNVVSATTSIAPPAATTLRALATATTIDLAWIDVADETAYRIERSPSETSDWTSIGTTGQDVTTYTDAALGVDVMYRYRVVATNAGGDSTPSNVVVAKIVKVTTPPDDSPPPPPDGEKPPKKTKGDAGAPESPVTEDPAVIGESSAVESS